MRLIQNLLQRIRNRKPLSLASDILLVVLVVMLVIPTTRGIILSGVAGVRAFFTPVASHDPSPTVAEDWSWQLVDKQGNIIPFSTLKGEVIFLNQWATWCPPCRAEMPSIEKLYKALGDKVRFVLLTNENPEVVKGYLDRWGYTFPVYLGTVAGPSFRSGTIPVTVILNRKGEVVVKKRGAFNWNARKIRNLLSDLTD